MNSGYSFRLNGLQEKRMQDLFSRPTYILFELPETITGLVNGFRKRFDPSRSGLNAEVSIIGSSGAGPVSPGQPPQKVFGEIDRIAGKLNSFQAGFNAVDSFPGTGIYFFTMTEEGIFRRIHQLFREAEIQYLPSPFPYCPHCTLTLFEKPLPAAAIWEITALPVPKERFEIDNISVYSIDEHESHPELLYRVELKN